jgi:tetratricopeptide (TPR) repeat protein
LTAVYRALLRNKHVLIILDGVLDKKAVVPFLPPPGSTLLVTTQVVLDLPSAYVITLDALNESEAMELLRTALGAGATEEIADMVRSAGNYPWVLNLVADAIGRNGSGRERVREFLTNRQAQSGDSSGKRAPALLELLESQVQRLDPCPAQTLYQLSVFAAPFDAAAAQAVLRVPGCLGLGGEIGAALKTLEQAGLLAFDGATKLYSVHPLVQQFAQERLTDSEAVQARYAKYWTAQGRSFAEQYRQGGADSEAAVAWFDQNRPHLRAAFDWLRAHDAQRLVEFVQGVTELAAVRLPPEEWIAWLQAQGDAAEQINAGEITAATLLNLGVGHYLAGAPKRAVRFFEQALAAARDIHDRRLEAAALGNLGVAYIDLGDFGRARDFLEAQLSLVRELGDLRGEAAALGNMGDVHLVAGDYEQAEYWYREQLARAEEAGDVRAEAEAMGDWGLVLAGRGEAQQGRRLLERQLKRVRELGDRHSEAAARGNLGTVWAALGNQKAAIGAYEQQLALLRETGSRRGEGKALANLGAAYATQGKARRAVDLYEQALVRQRDSGDRLAEGITLGNLGNAYADLGDQRRALEYLEQGLFALRSVGYTAAEAQILSGLSRVYAALGDTAAASEYRERAQTQTKMQTADAGPAVTQIVVGNVTVFRPAPGRVRGGREPG